jgi:putative transposase
MPRPARRSGADARPRSARSAPRSCAWPARTPHGATAESTKSSPPWASRSPPRPSGKSCRSTALRPRRNVRARPGADFLRSPADALLACDFFETRTLTGARLYIFAVIEHATGRIRILGATAHPTAACVVQLGRNLVMDLEDVDSRARFLIRHRDPKGHAGLRRRAGRCRTASRQQRCPDAPDELHHAALDTDLPTRTAGPHPHMRPTPSAVPPCVP